MSTASKSILLALQYAPSVSNAVRQLQQTHSDLPGPNRKAVIMDSITAACQIGETVPEEHVALISCLIETAVGLVKRWQAEGALNKADSGPKADNLSGTTIAQARNVGGAGTGPRPVTGLGTVTTSPPFPSTSTTTVTPPPQAPPAPSYPTAADAAEGGRTRSDGGTIPGPSLTTAPDRPAGNP
jgi:hypothetical protein